MMKNGEGYLSPTEGRAISNIMREYKQKQREEWERKNKIMRRPKVYIVSKYARDTKENIKRARKYCRFAVKNNKLPIASHLLYPQFLNDEDPTEREIGMLFGLALLRTCKEVWCFGTDYSEGMKKEIHEAKRLKKRIRYFDYEMEEMLWKREKRR